MCKKTPSQRGCWKSLPQKWSLSFSSPEWPFIPLWKLQRRSLAKKFNDKQWAVAPPPRGLAFPVQTHDCLFLHWLASSSEHQHPWVHCLHKLVLFLWLSAPQHQEAVPDNLALTFYLTDSFICKCKGNNCSCNYLYFYLVKRCCVIRILNNSLHTKYTSLHLFANLLSALASHWPRIKLWCITLWVNNCLLLEFFLKSPAVNTSVADKALLICKVSSLSNVSILIA